MHVRVGDPGAIWVKAVLLDGENVTNLCFMADEEEGLVGVYRSDADGNKFATSEGLPVEEFRRGTVVIEMKPEWSA